MSQHSNEYQRQHWYVRKQRGKASIHKCFFCLVKSAREWALIFGCNPDEVISYVPSCIKCHRNYDKHNAWTEDRRQMARERLMAKWMDQEFRGKMVSAKIGNTNGSGNKGRKQSVDQIEKARIARWGK